MNKMKIIPLSIKHIHVGILMCLFVVGHFSFSIILEKEQLTLFLNDSETIIVLPLNSKILGDLLLCFFLLSICSFNQSTVMNFKVMAPKNVT